MQISKCDTLHLQDKRQNRMIISIDTEKAKEIQNPFMIKMLNKLITEECTST